MKRDTVLLLGGKNKGYDYGKLFAYLKNSKVVQTVLYGENRFELMRSAQERQFEKVTLCEKFSFAVHVASMLANRGQAVLLSPASASFDRFKNFAERGRYFKELVSKL